MVDIPDPPYDEVTTAVALIERMLGEMSPDLDQGEGSFAWSLIAPSAVELARVWDNLDLLVQIMFVQTTYGDYLDARAEEHGVTRKDATKAVGTVTFTGSAGAEIPAGTEVSTTVLVGSDEEPIVFVTDELGIVTTAGTVDVPVTAFLAGEDGNVAADAIDRFVLVISGVSSVTNAAAMAGGTDDETDEELRSRLLGVVANPVGAGTESDYERWAEEVDGVGYAYCVGLYSGAGTVQVWVLDADREPAGSTLLSDVEDYIATLSPIGADVTIGAPTNEVVAVSATLTMEPGATVAAVQTAVEDAIQAYMETLAVGDDVILNEVGAAIITVAGVADYSSLQLGGAGTNYTIAASEIAKMGTVSLS